MSEKRRFEKIVTNPVKKEQKTIGQAFLDIFFPGSISEIKDVLLYEMIIPKVKKAIPIVGRDILEMLVSPDTRASTKTYRDRDKVRVSYDRYSKKDDRYERRTVKKSNLFENPLFETRKEAQDILENMLDAIERFGAVSVMDVYDMIGEENFNIADDRYGWTDLRGAEIRPYRGDFLLDLPRPRYLD